MRAIPLLILMLLLNGYAFSQDKKISEKISIDQYKKLDLKSLQEYEVEKAQCKVLKDASFKMCHLKADGNRKVSVAWLRASLNPTLENNVDAKIVQAKVDYTVAVALCHDQPNKTNCINHANLMKDKTVAQARAFK